MNEANNRDSEFLGYEYKELSVEQSRVSMYLDGYKNYEQNGADQAAAQF